MWGSPSAYGLILLQTLVAGAVRPPNGRAREPREEPNPGVSSSSPATADESFTEAREAAPRREGPRLREGAREAMEGDRRCPGEGVLNRRKSHPPSIQRLTGIWQSAHQGLLCFPDAMLPAVRACWGRTPARSPQAQS